jgi:hypothetical protein
MKKLLSIAMASLAVAAFADPPANTASPTIGVTAITTTNKNTIVAVPFTSLDGSGDISVKDLVSTDGLSLGDWLYVFANNTYTAWTLTTDGWTPAASASTSGNIITAGAADANQKVAAPGAIWLVFKDAPTSDSPKTFYIYGKYDTPSMEQTIVAGNNLVANPTQSSASFSFKTGSTPVKGDVIIIPHDNIPERYTYTNTRKAPNVYGWYKNNVSTDLPTIPAGLGFWYVRAAGSENIVIKWGE